MNAIHSARPAWLWGIDGRITLCARFHYRDIKAGVSGGVLHVPRRLTRLRRVPGTNPLDASPRSWRFAIQDWLARRNPEFWNPSCNSYLVTSRPSHCPLPIGCRCAWSFQHFFIIICWMSTVCGAVQIEATSQHLELFQHRHAKDNRVL